ncbi:hypothetical protein [Cryobacterium arcticum]|uniref:Uncharacterized protein n=1 Tax=Cryobacterium arcticum TaxID=670052 RepID=A0A317ZQ07_9MICO|nr:hypothetical protein [Cryobacterium arcticum]PXA67133.1 hypothetical protein CTB96_10230 [Cryobacterium arcticum]
MLWWLAGACLAGSSVIWALWVVPVSASVAEARPTALGESIDLSGTDGSGVWATGSAALLGLVQCRAETVDGRTLATRAVPSPGWDDTLWWMTPRESYTPLFSVEDSDGVAASITCASRLADYEGDFLVADDVSGGGSAVGLGRGGNIDYPVGTLLALGAVMGPLFGVALTVTLILQGVRSRLRRRTPVG